MSKVSEDDVLRLAKLARIKLDNEQVKKFAKEFSDIVVYVEQLNNVDTTGLEPTYQVSGLVNQTREDVEKEIAHPDDLMKSVTTEKVDRQFKVKRMVG